MLKKIIVFFKKHFKAFFHFQHHYTLEEIAPAFLDKDTNVVFDAVKPGDIIIALTPGKYDQLARIGATHRMRPYIVAEKKKNYLIGYCGSSKGKYRSYFDLTMNYYSVRKDGVINLGKKQRISKKHISSIIDELTTIDCLKINDILYEKKKSILIDIPKEFVEGRVVKYKKKLYWIYHYQKDGISKVFPLFEITTPREITFAYQKKLYSLDKKEKPLEKKITTKYFPTSIITTHPIDIINHKVPKETKKKKVQKNFFENKHFYDFEIGKRFCMHTDVYLYLFSSKKKHYTIREYDIEDVDEIPSLHCIKDIELYKEDGIEEDDKLMFYLEDFVNTHPSYQWLLDELTEVVKE